MNSNTEKRPEYEQVYKIDAAIRAGDLDALRAAADDPDSVPNGRMPLEIGTYLEYAIYHSPLAFIRELLEIGADPNLDDNSGFPPLIAALSAGRVEPGAVSRTDVLQILDLLLSYGADPNQRGLNDYTPLHMAVGERNLPALKLLLERGADPNLKTRIDDYETPREMAEAVGLGEFAVLLKAYEDRKEP